MNSIRPEDDAGLADVVDRHWDVVVVGAGPAGATAAAHLAAHGHTVLILDKEPFPREKVCGDGLIPDALKCLQSLQLLESVRAQGHSVRSVTVYSPSRFAVHIPAECITMRRETLDAHIAAQARRWGATFRVADATQIRQEFPGGASVIVKHSQQPLRARIGIIASGADVRLLGTAGLAPRAKASAIALRCYVQSPVELDRLIVSFDRLILPGYGWIFPLGGGEYNVGCGVFYHDDASDKINLREAFQTFTTKMPIASELMRRATSVTPLRGARLRSGLEGASCYDGGDIIAIGESIGTTYPFTGEGIGKAMETGELAARQVHLSLQDGTRQPLTQLSRLIDERLAPRYVGYRLAQRWLSRPWLTDLLAWRVSRSAALTQAAAGILSETADPRSVFSWRTFLPRWTRAHARV